MYQNRPIYWLFSSAKGAFKCLAYMHRMDAYTAERVRQNYLLPYIEYLQNQIADLEKRAASLSTAENRKLQNFQKALEECREYHERLQVVAEHAIAFDLDDGVIVNYAKFGDVLAKIK
jgi:type II restriction/modification system DNA methylase subunit YeeA